MRVLLIPLLGLTALPLDAQTTRTQRGDTIVVTTTGPGRWGATPRLAEELRLDGATHETTFGQIGRMWALPDGGVLVADLKSLDGPALRRFDATGRFVGNIGRSGQGPGEFTTLFMLDVAVRADGHMLVRDGVRSVNHFGPDGRLIRLFALNHNNGSTNEIIALQDGRIAVRAPFARGPSATESGLLRPFHFFSAQGQLMDSISDRKPWRAPAAPGEVFIRWWRLLPDGAEVQSRSDIVGFLRTDPTGKQPPLIAQVPRTGVPYTREERRHANNLLSFSRDSCPRAGMPQQPPVDIPADRPPARGHFSTDLAGRVWVSISAPGERVSTRVAASCSLPGSAPKEYRLNIADPVAHAVFEADGNYLGDLRFPYGTVIAPGRDHLWVALRDADEVQYVVKYRLPHGG